MITQERFKEIEVHANALRELYPQWREGQAFFNALYEMEPDAADFIRGTNLDMFYNTDNIEHFRESL